MSLGLLSYHLIKCFPISSIGFSGLSRMPSATAIVIIVSSVTSPGSRSQQPPPIISFKYPYFLSISSFDMNSSVPPRASPQATPKSPPSMRSYLSTIKYTSLIRIFLSFSVSSLQLSFCHFHKSSNQCCWFPTGNIHFFFLNGPKQYPPNLPFSFQ